MDYFYRDSLKSLEHIDDEGYVHMEVLQVNRSPIHNSHRRDSNSIPTSFQFALQVLYDSDNSPRRPMNDKSEPIVIELFSLASKNSEGKRF